MEENLKKVLRSELVSLKHSEGQRLPTPRLIFSIREAQKYQSDKNKFKNLTLR